MNARPHLFEPLAPGATIGILGGGQLGRMLAMAAHKLGLRAHIYCPDPASPAFDVTRFFTVADYNDEAALAGFAAQVDVITYEFENVPSSTAAFLAARKPVFPGEKALETCQDRLKEKTFLSEHGIAVAPFAAVDSLADLQEAVQAIGRPGVLKSRRFGYDGKGQAFVGKDTDLGAAWHEAGEGAAIYEGFVSFSREISIIAARGLSGEVVSFAPVENEHRNHILHRSLAPAPGLSATDEAAIHHIARTVGEALGYVGVFCVELFETADGFVANEIAPRVHNSGHWTVEACLVSQFEQHMRAVSGWPLAPVVQHSGAVMTNLLGHDVDDWQGLARHGGLQLYGKRSARPGRKMGHITALEQG